MLGRTTLGRSFQVQTYNDVANVPDSSGNEPPTYLDKNNKPRDKFYRLIAGLKFDPDQDQYRKEDPITRTMVPLIYHVPGEPMPFPCPAKFEEDVDYEGAVKKWFYDIRNRFSSTILPVPITGEFFVPQGPKIFRAEEKADASRFRTFKAAAWPLFPDNYMDMLNIIFTQRKVNGEEPFPHQIPRRDTILYKHHISSELQWQSQLLTHEPVPELYESFAEFETSYKNWKSVVLDEVEKPIMTPKQFAQLLGLNVVKTEEAGAVSDDMTLPREAESEPWAKRVRKPKNIDKIEKWCTKAKEILEEPVETVTPQWEVLMVSGLTMSPSQFVRDMENYGDHVTKEMMDQPNHPIGYLRVFEQTVTHEMIFENVLNSHMFELSMMMQLMECQLTAAQLCELMTKKVDGKLFVNVLDEPTNAHILKTIFPAAYRSLNYAHRVSLFVHAIFQYDKKCKLEEVWNPHGDLVRFRQLVVLLSFSTDARVWILPMLGNEVQKADMINLVYFLSMFLEVMKNYQGATYYIEAMTKVREVSYELATALKDPNFRLSIRNNQLALLMLLSCDSRQIHRMILGEDFLVWLNEMSQRKEGIVAIQTIIHGPAMRSALILFLQVGYTYMRQIVPTMTTYLSSLITAICDTIRGHRGQSPIKIRGQKVLQTLEACLERTSIVTIRTSMSLAALLLDPSFIENLSEASFFQLIGEALGKFCATITGEDVELYQWQMRLLAMFVSDVRCAMAMVNTKGFANVLVSFIDTPDPIAFALTWQVIDSVVTEEHAMRILFKSKEFPAAVVTIPNRIVEDQRVTGRDQTCNRRALLKFLNFSTQALSGAGDISTTYGDLMVPCIGSIVRLFKGRKLVFEDDDEIRKALEDFVQLCTETLKTKDSLKKLTGKFRKYMTEQNRGSLPFGLKKKTNR